MLFPTPVSNNATQSLSLIAAWQAAVLHLAHCTAYAAHPTAGPGHARAGRNNYVHAQ